MRNLKRVLSLALAAMMLIGMMVVGASAANAEDFTDYDEIQHKEAVNSMVTLNVIAGMEDGSTFNPTGTLTREQMSKIITYVMNGGVEPALGVKDVPTYSDIDNTWAEKYIEYATSAGIIAGDGTGKFNPTDTLTGEQAAKMLLVAMGYNAKVFGFEGNNWAINVNRYANEAGLYDGLGGMDPSQPISRDDACQLAYNAIQATMMEKTWSINPATGEMTEGYQLWITLDGGVSVPHTMLGEKFGVVEVEGVVTANEFATIGADGASLAAGKTELGVISDSTRHHFNGGDIFNVSTGEDLLGRTVILYAKVDTNATSDSTKAVIVGEPIVSDKNVVATTTAGYGTNKTLTNFATKNNLTAATGAVYSYNYGDDNSGAIDANYNGAGRGIVTTLVDNNADSKYEYAFVVEYKFGEVTSKVTTGDGTIAISGGPDANDYASKDIAGFDDVARGDFVNYIEVGGILYVAKAETVSGQMTQFDDKDQTYITVDGTEYGTSEVGAHRGVIEPTILAAAYCDSSYLNKDGVFYLDSCGNIVAVGDVEAASQYAFIIDSQFQADDNLDDTAKAKAALSADGTTVTKPIYAIDKNSDGVIATGEKNVTADPNKLYTYTVNGEDQFTLTPVTLVGGDEKSDVAVKFTKGETTVTVDGTKYFADGDTAYFFIAPKGTYDVDAKEIIDDLTPATIDSVSAYTGYQNAPSFDSSLMAADAYAGKTDCMLVVDANDPTLVKAIVVVTESAGLSSNLMYLYDYVGDNEYGQVFNVIKDGEIVENVTITSGATKDSEGMVAKYAETKNGYSVVALSSGSVVSGNITVKADNSIVVGGQEYKMTSSTIIANIDGDNTTVTDVALVKGDYVTVAYNTDMTIEAVYVTVPYAANNAEIHSTNAKWSDIDNKAATYTGATTDTCADLLDGVVISYNATVTVYDARTAGTTGDLVVGDYVYADTDIVNSADTLTNATAYYVVVTSQDGSTHTVYTVTAALS